MLKLSITVALPAQQRCAQTISANVLNVLSPILSTKIPVPVDQTPFFHPYFRPIPVPFYPFRTLTPGTLYQLLLKRSQLVFSILFITVILKSECIYSIPTLFSRHTRKKKKRKLSALEKWREFEKPGFLNVHWFIYFKDGDFLFWEFLSTFPFTIPDPDQHSGYLNYWLESAAFVITSANG